MVVINGGGGTIYNVELGPDLLVCYQVQNIFTGKEKLWYEYMKIRLHNAHQQSGLNFYSKGRSRNKLLQQVLLKIILTYLWSSMRIYR